jgi:membrane protease YdiL (CAAX protease family)
MTIQHPHPTKEIAMQTDTTIQRLQVPSRLVYWYLVAVMIIGTALMAVPAVTDLPAEPFILAMVFGPLLGGAMLTARRSGPGGVRQLFSGVLRWRIGWRYWALAVVVMPLMTVTVAAATGTLASPAEGWLTTATDYLVATFLVGTLVINLWEETAWQGLVQRHLTGRFGLGRGALLTAVPFAVIHLPLGFVGGATLREALVASILVLVMAPPFRYLLGRTDHATGGSLLAVGVLHASFNASGSLDVLVGGWQHIVGVAVVAAAALLMDTRRRTTPQRMPIDAQLVQH